MNTKKYYTTYEEEKQTQNKMKTKTTTKKKTPTKQHECLRCGRTWTGKKTNPTYCPVCKSPYWNKPRLKRPNHNTK